MGVWPSCLWVPFDPPHCFFPGCPGSLATVAHRRYCISPWISCLLRFFPSLSAPGAFRRTLLSFAADTSENTPQAGGQAVDDGRYSTFFLQPTNTAHRHYEVLRAIFVERQP